MNDIVTILVVFLKSLLIPASVMIGFLLITFTIRYFLLKRISTIAEKTKTHIDDIVLSSIRAPSIIWCLMISFYFGLYLSQIPPEWTSVLTKTLLVLGILSVTMVMAGTATKAVVTYSEQSDTPYQLSSFSRNIISVLIFITGGLIILSSLGISIAPFLATLGVGGLAVALGLQETLANLFAGFYIIASKQVRVNDYVKLESGQEGYVTDINWRTAKIRMLSNNIILVPNSKLAQTIITNYYFPEKEMAVSVDVGVHYNSDLKHVEKVTIETAAEIMKTVTGGVPGFQPLVRYNKFGDFYIGFSVVMRAREFSDQYLIKHEFIKALHERYRKEGIVIPYPVQAVNYQQENAQGIHNTDRGNAPAIR